MIALWWCRVAVFGLILLQPLWFGWLTPPEVVPPWFAVTLTTVPLILVAHGVWRLQTRSLVVAGCLLLLYFCLAVMEVWAHPAARIPAAIQIFLIALFFTALPAVRSRPVDNG